MHYLNNRKHHLGFRKQRRKAKNKTADTVPSEIAAHIESMGFVSVVDYKQWCKSNNFSGNLNKDREQRYQERVYRSNQIACEILKKHNESKSGKSVIEKIYKGEPVKPANYITAELSRCFDSSKHRNILYETLAYLDTCSKLTGDADHIRGVANAVAHYGAWKRPVKEWKPNMHNAGRQFSSLVRHLFAGYNIPEFMDSVWLSLNRLHQRWFIHLGSGKNIRSAERLPITLTKKMAHKFLSAPSGYSVNAAFRWAQITAMGGDRRLADAISGTRLSRDFKHDKFWLSVFRFFIDNPMLDTAQINPIVDYIWNQKYEDQIVFVERGVAENRGPAQPNFSLKGRTVDTLLRQVNAWHRSLGRELKGGKLQWEKSKFEDFEFIEGTRENKNIKIWRIHELLSNQELVAEGRALHHCVASYAVSCKRGRSGIWTMSCEDASGFKKLLTIEVLLRNRQICQVRGKNNRLPTEQEKKIVQRWAVKEQLQYST